MFSYVLGSGWLQAGWLGRLAGIHVLTSKKQVLHVFFIVLHRKPAKTECFHTFSGASKCRISQYSATLSPFAILAPKCQFHKAFVRVTFKKDCNFQSGAL